MWIDFNNDGMFNNAEELIGGMMENAHPPTTRPPAGLKVSLTDAIPATAVRNQVLSLRVLNELSTIYGQSQLITDACMDPYFGQAKNTRSFAGNDVQLNWQTSLEQNSAGFDIEVQLTATTT